MKQQVLISLILFSSVMVLNAQIYTPSGTIQGSSGNNYVGIGIPNPAYPLDIQSSSSSLNIGIGGSNQTYYSNIKLKTNEGDAQIFRTGTSYTTYGGPNSLNIYNSSIAPITFYQSSNERMRIHSNGFIGIGTSNPGYPLDIQSSSFSYLNVNIGGTTQTDYSNIILNSDGGNAQIFKNGSSYTSYGGINSLNIYNSAIAPITFYQSSNERMRIASNGSVGIGTSTPDSRFKLDVEGTIRASEVKVCLQGGCDFVFRDDYKLLDLKELEQFVRTNQHLPEVAPEKDMIENGVNMKELQMKLLQKVEELTLYTIEQNKELLLLKEKIAKLEAASKKEGLKKQQSNNTRY
ncbi:MAG TPA: hypothetical protein VHO72_13030 [Bacteroidales bacterium]|nr:hypothetical protein [Bacteroidales bacterium]